MVVRGPAGRPPEEVPVSEINYVSLAGALDDLVKGYNRLRAWHDRVDMVLLGRRAGIADAESWLGNKRPPGKQVKHDTYADASRVQQIMGDTGPRSQNLEDVGKVIDAARKVIKNRLNAVTLEPVA